MQVDDVAESKKEVKEDGEGAKAEKELDLYGVINKLKDNICNR